MKCKLLLGALLSITVICCSKNDAGPEPIDIPIPGQQLVQLPVVVHMIHNGEDIGQGPNLSKERILRQIEILNEDFRKKKGTKGHNEHPDGADTQIEFVLAKSNPESEPFDGINRIDASKKQVDDLGYNQNHFAQYAYWDPEHYINIWVAPLPLETACMVLGSSTGPKTELPGSDLLLLPQPGDAEGILVNWIHFGESDIDCHARFGRTLTHEMGHYLGLLHTWGGKDCVHNDYCNDTPAVDRPVFGPTAFKGCSGETIMIGNYMNYSDDAVMNIFTNHQAERMHYVLKNHSGRKSLLTSPAL
ncbi:M43 family zinc metalloprotease [Allomuricauda taeanensis]|uniref:M43 family zinc metalloprotease n=1 Tax=Flagellimonas taeanensis TaxID=1005926 RepID=UPI002E7B30D6|nr:M43 family zinc metalloprotease [Allomuricauda taeanensis]MEE1962711.1 M43 family zinc metalloprotease [Allomuricauda taeanensis]